MLISVLRPIPPQAIAFVKTHEGCKLTASPDVAGHMDGGYGHDDPTLRPGQPITQDQADSWLAADLQIAAQKLETCVGEACVGELTDNQYAALISFTFNVGLLPTWGIVAKLKAQDFDGVPSEMMRFVNAGGVKVQGLVNRRADEVKLWSTAEPGSVPSAPSSSYTRAVDTPPTPVAQNPLMKTWHYVAGLGTTGAAIAADQAPRVKGGMDQIQSAIGPYVGHSTVLAGISDHLALATAAMAALTVVLIAMSHRKAASQ